jgi:hypothetical protein
VRFADETNYEISCHWSASPEPIKMIASDWDIRLRASYPAIRQMYFDPFENCPQFHQGDEVQWHAPPGAPSRADCQDAMNRSFPRRMFSRPIVTADHRYAVLYESGSPWPQAGGVAVTLLRFQRGRWRHIATLSSAAG